MCCNNMIYIILCNRFYYLCLCAHNESYFYYGVGMYRCITHVNGTPTYKMYVIFYPRYNKNYKPNTNNIINLFL